MKKMLLLSCLLLVLRSYGQSSLIPYRVGKLWGLADTTGVVKLAPFYDEIEPEYIRPAQGKEILPFFITKKNKKYGVLLGTKTILTNSYNRLLIDSTFIIELNSVGNDPIAMNSRKIIRNLKGTVLFPDSLMGIMQVRQDKQPGGNLLYETTGSMNRSGAFWYNPQQQIVAQWLFKEVSYVSLSYIKNRLYAYVHKTAKSGMETYELTFNAALKKYDIRPAVNAGSAEHGLYKAQGNDLVRVKSNNLLVEKKLQETAGGWIQVTRTQRYSDKTDRRDTLKLRLKADSVILKDYSSGQFGQYHTTDSYRSNHNDTIYTYHNYLIYNHAGKKGLFAEDTVVPAVYDELIYFKSSARSKPYFMAAKRSVQNEKTYWGVVDATGKEVLSIIYDQIIRSAGSNTMWIIKKDNLYGITNNAGKIIFPVKYDKINPGESFLNFSIMHQGKYGWLNMSMEHVEPIFPYPVNRALTFGGHQVFELMDSNGKILGFGDPKGFLYFRN